MPIPESRLTATADIRRIVQGEVITLTVEIFDEVTRQVVDLTDAADALITLPGTTEPVTLMLGSGVELADDPGRLLVSLTAEQTAALKVAEGQSWQVQVMLADDSVRIVQLFESLDVVASLF